MKDRQINDDRYLRTFVRIHNSLLQAALDVTSTTALLHLFVKNKRRSWQSSLHFRAVDRYDAGTLRQRITKVLMRIATLTLVSLFGAAAYGQENDDSVSDYEQTGELIAELAGDIDISGAEVTALPTKRMFSNWPSDLIIAPVPGRSPQLGWQLTLAGGYFFESKNDDSDAPPSIVGGFIMGAENGSTAYGVGSHLHLRDDNIRVKAGIGYADIRYRLYGKGNEAGERGIGLKILQNGPLYTASVKWRVWNKLYIGLGYIGGEIETRARVEIPDTLALSFDPSIAFDLGAFTIPVEYDTRDNDQFPSSGWFAEANARFFRESLGSGFDSESFELGVNHYRPVHQDNVLAFRGYVKSTKGDPPFFLLSSFGGQTDLRGYESGRYRDNVMYALQSEYRWQFNDSWIFTGFAGVGEVAESFNDIGENFLPAVGLGVRYVLSKKHKVGLSADLAYGKDGAEFYFGVGESF